MAARHDRFQVCSDARALGDRALEVNVADEDDRRLEVEGIGDLIRIQHTALLVPADATLVSGVQRALQ